MKMEQSAPKRRHIKFRFRGITQKKEYNKECTNFSQTQQIIVLLQRHVSTRTSHHRAIFEPRLRCTINRAHFGIPKVYMVLDYCYHVYPTIVKILLRLTSIQSIQLNLLLVKLSPSVYTRTY